MHLFHSSYPPVPGPRVLGRQGSASHFRFHFFLKSFLFHGKNEADLKPAMIYMLSQILFFLFLCFLNLLIGKYVVIFLKTSNGIVTCGGTYVVYKDTKAVP